MPIRDCILVVENDPMVCDLIAREALEAAGYQALTAGDASAAIVKAVEAAPDLIISDINLPGLNGKDLIMALNSQGLDIPVIMVAKKGEEADIIHAFRVGAVDYLLWPAREAQIINTVERVLKQVHERREREQLQRQLQQTNQELQNRVQELTTIFAIGKAVTSVTDFSLLFERILDGAIKVTRADLGWFFLRESSANSFRLVAQRNLTPAQAEVMKQAWDDGLTSLVTLSGESLSIDGEALKRFKISSLGQSALIVPIKAQKQVNGLLVCMRRHPATFKPGEQRLLEAIADYASISLVNARLFGEVERRAARLEAAAGLARTGEKVNAALMEAVKAELQKSLQAAGASLDSLVKDPAARWNPNHLQYLATLQDQLKNLGRVADGMVPAKETPGASPAAWQADLSDLARRAASGLQQVARQGNITLSLEFKDEAMLVLANPGLVFQVLTGLISNAIKFSNPGGQVSIRLERIAGPAAHGIVINSCQGIELQALKAAFDPGFRAPDVQPRRFGGIGIGLSLIKEIITGQNGRIWVESQPGQGVRFHFTLPLVK